MMFLIPLRFIFLACVCCLCMAGASGQQSWDLKGTIYDVSAKTPVESVIVMTSSGRGTLTDSMGRYKIQVNHSDSVYFSYQNKMTPKYPVAKMEDPQQFNMSLHIYVYALPNVTVRGRSYRTDSLMNRQQYAKYFNFSKPNPLTSVNVANGGVGMDPNEIINMFRFKRNRQLAELSNRLIREEQDKYVDYRFSKSFIHKLTLLEGDELKRFMEKYRPPYDYAVLTNELEMGYYIQQCYRKEKGQLPSGVILYQLGAEYIGN